jgi:hypothetical protein
MNSQQWHSALDGEQKGPVSGEDFERLISAGVVGRDTMVWTDGMAAWETLAKVRPDTTPPAPPTALPPSSTAIPEAGQAVCAQCGQVVSTEAAVPLAGRMICARCKPLAVQMLKEGVSPVNSQAEQVRREHIGHEASIKSVGELQMLGGILMGLISLFGLYGFVTSNSSRAISVAVVGLVATGGMSVLFLWNGFGLWRLRPSARWAGVILCVVFMIVGFPIGTIINGYILWLLVSRKGKVVFSDEYQRIIAETPHVKFRTPVYAWVILALFIAGLVLLAAYFG